MTKACNRYKKKQISRYIDGELPRHQLKKIRQHLDTCPACRELAAQFRDAARSFNELADLPGVDIDPARLYRTIKKPAEKPAGLRIGRFFSRPVRHSLAAAASIAVLVFISMYALKNDSPAPAGPSAIVTSIDTDYTAVMILETPGTHHTIIWYSGT
ncbi:MAG: zf-HC2 domain-containing protein [Desulfotignum sp.]|nr:zf-HC2 domain-containing protein [Desulfotignum sp.]